MTGGERAFGTAEKNNRMNVESGSNRLPHSLIAVQNNSQMDEKGRIHLQSNVNTTVAVRSLEADSNSKNGVPQADGVVKMADRSSENRNQSGIEVNEGKNQTGNLSDMKFNVSRNTTGGVAGSLNQRPTGNGQAPMGQLGTVLGIITGNNGGSGPTEGRSSGRYQMPLNGSATGSAGGGAIVDQVSRDDGVLSGGSRVNVSLQLSPEKPPQGKFDTGGGKGHDQHSFQQESQASLNRDQQPSQRVGGVGRIALAGEIQRELDQDGSARKQKSAVTDGNAQNSDLKEV
jgi:hypothetical protein